MMKAMKAKEVPLHKLEFPLIAQLKFDGVRLITKVVKDLPTFYTFNGNEVPLPKLRQQILDAQLGDVMLDGELITGGGKNGTRTIVSGMVNSAMHGGTINESLLTYVLFDTMGLKSFESQASDMHYRHRYNITANRAEQAGLAIARNVHVNSVEEIEELKDQVYNDGYEGLVLKPPFHLYKFSRSNDWVKIKETKTADLLCTSVTPGTGKYEGMIGALVCSGVVEGKHIIVKAGSGLNDKQRARKPSYYINKTIELKYNSIIQDTRTGAWSLFLPRFHEVRIDK